MMLNIQLWWILIGTLYKIDGKVHKVMRNMDRFRRMLFPWTKCDYNICNIVMNWWAYWYTLSDRESEESNSHKECDYIIQLYIYEYMTGVILHLNGVDIQSEYSTMWEKWSSDLTHSLK